MNPPQNRIRWLGPLLAAYWLLLFAATHLPSGALPPTGLGDKFEHFIAYAVLAFLLVAWIRLTAPWEWTRRWAAFIGLALCAVYAGLDELTQPIVGRVCDFRDFLADCVGAAIGALLAMMLLRRSGLSSDPK